MLPQPQVEDLRVINTSLDSDGRVFDGVLTPTLPVAIEGEENVNVDDFSLNLKSLSLVGFKAMYGIPREHRCSPLAVH